MRPARTLLILVALLAPGWAALAGPGSQTNAGGSGATPAPSGSPGSGNQLNPFASPTPSGTPGPIGNGFVLLGYDSANAAGGVIPLLAPTAAPPSPFPASNAAGFFAELTGRFSPTYGAALRFHDYSLHGGDDSVVNLSEGSLFYMPRGNTLALGLGYASLQRSSSNASANSVGLGAWLLPDFRHSLSPYASLSYYPSGHTLGSTAGITAGQAGIIFRAPRTGLLLQLGYDYVAYPNQNFSPTSLSGLQFGLGVSF